MAITHSSTAQQKIITSFIVFAVMAVLVVGVNATAKDDTASSQPATSQASGSKSTGSGNYKDGTYKADGNYSSPGGAESIGVTVTLAGNTISDAVVEGKADGGVAELYQNYFIKGFKTMVVGKNIDDISVSRVAGSSLTSKGFNDALKKIKQQADQG